MKFLVVAVFFVALAYVSAGGIGLPLATSRGALEGALGGQWIPDVPAAQAPLAAAPWAAAPWSAASIVGAPAATIAARTVVAPGLGLGAPVVSAKGALEGALGGQWIPDVPAADAPLAATPWAAAPWSAASIVGAPAATIAARTVVAPGLALGAPVVSAKGALEGALGGQWIPDVPAADAPLAATPWAAASWSAAPWSAASIVGAPAANIAAKTVIATGHGLGAPVSAKGALEGALGGQWIPDVLPEH